ncbi:MAG: right-handed parallel beta-helix repeat-containing protein, partial [Prevotella sp.]|nr:right-handed parallel beta-helix repeat-containing protein [Prevotella sp.]
WPQPVIGGEKGNSSFLIRKTEKRNGIERLVVVNGTEKEPVCHVNFNNLRFENTCWNRPLHYGHVTLQGGFPVIDAYKLPKEGLPWAPSLENQAWIERPVAAVSVAWARNISFQNCHFSHLASTALDFHIGISDCLISDNRFDSIGGTAILAGSFAESPREVHRPYTDLAELCQRLTISSNQIESASCEDWGAVGIGCGYVRDVTIANNEVSRVNYSGICVGWGWTSCDTGMRNNRITGNIVTDFARQLYDAGGIYTLSNQPNSIIEGNLIDRLGAAPYATNDRGVYIYLDAETDGNTIRNNQFPEKRIGDNHPGPNIVWGKNRILRSQP